MPRVIKRKCKLVASDFENVGTGGFAFFDDSDGSTYTEPEGEGNPESQDLGELDPDGDMGDEEEMTAVDRENIQNALKSRASGGGAAGDESDVVYLRNEAEDPERTSSQPAAGVDAALGSAFNSGGRRNDIEEEEEEEEEEDEEEPLSSGGGAAGDESESEEEKEWTGTYDELLKLPWDEFSKYSIDPYCPGRHLVKTFLKLLNRWGSNITIQAIAELMVRPQFNYRIHVFHCPQLDGITRIPLDEREESELREKNWNLKYVPDFLVDPNQGPVIVPVSYEDVRKLTAWGRKNHTPVTLFFTCDWMCGPRAAQESLPEVILDKDPHLKEYNGQVLFSVTNFKLVLKALNRAHDSDYKKKEEKIKKEEKAREKELRAERAAAREAARIAEEEAQATEAARVQAEEDNARREAATAAAAAATAPAPRRKSPRRPESFLAPDRHVPKAPKLIEIPNLKKPGNTKVVRDESAAYKEYIGSTSRKRRRR
eukprot:SAG11_NODE_2677_length_3105_cov_160.712242_4_plen_484_part_00